MRNSKLVVLFIVFLLGCGNKILPTGPSEAVGTTLAPEMETGLAVSFLPAQTPYKVGDEVVMEIVVDNAEDLFGAATTIKFESDKLSFLWIEEGSFIKGQNPTSLMYAIKQEKVVVGLTTLRKIRGVSGNGVLFRLTFKARRSGKTTLEFQETTLKDSSLNKMPFQSYSSVITIE